MDYEERRASQTFIDMGYPELVGCVDKAVEAARPLEATIPSAEELLTAEHVKAAITLLVWAAAHAVDNPTSHGWYGWYISMAYDLNANLEASRQS